MAHALIALGSNLGERAAQLTRAIDAISRLPNTQLLARSGWNPTAPVGGPTGQGAFLNAVVLASTSLDPLQLFVELQRIEIALGRVRGERWGARTLDLDLLLYEDVELHTANLTLPHPRMSFRRFVLARRRSGAVDGPCRERLDNCEPPAASQRYAETIAVAGDDNAHSDWLIGEVATRLASLESGAVNAPSELPSLDGNQTKSNQPRRVPN